MRADWLEYKESDANRGEKRFHGRPRNSKCRELYIREEFWIVKFLSRSKTRMFPRWDFGSTFKDRGSSPNVVSVTQQKAQTAVEGFRFVSSVALALDDPRFQFQALVFP